MLAPTQEDVEELDLEEEETAEDAEPRGPDPYAALSPRSRRKRKNRDQMRAARQRERETMERLRAMVERLEARYAALQVGQSQQIKTEAVAVVTTDKATTTDASGVAYAELLSLKAQYQEENFQLKQVLYDKGKLKQTLERYVGDVTPPSPEELLVMRQDLSSDAVGLEQLQPQRPLASSADGLFSDYVPQSADSVWRLVADAGRRIAEIQQSIHSQTPVWPSENGSSPSSFTVVSPSPSVHSEDDGISSSSSPPSPPHTPHTPHAPLPPFCGWNVRHQLTHNHLLLFEFTKSFPHIAAYGAMMRMWTNEMAMNTYRDPHEAQHQHQTMRVVQHISDNAYVMQRRLVDPATQRVALSTYVRFHTRTPQGFLIGLVSMEERDKDRSVKTEPGLSTAMKRDPHEEEEDHSFYAATVCVHTEFLPMVGNAGCTVRMLGSTSLDSPKNAQRNVADLIMTLLRWENVNIGPYFALTDR